jgi:hypothetical protein
LNDNITAVSSQLDQNIITQIDGRRTVRNEFGFPGDQTVGLPTLVQSPLRTNDIANPTG